MSVTDLSHRAGSREQDKLSALTELPLEEEERTVHRECRRDWNEGTDLAPGEKCQHKSPETKRWEAGVGAEVEKIYRG